MVDLFKRGTCITMHVVLCMHHYACSTDEPYLQAFASEFLENNDVFFLATASSQ